MARSRPKSKDHSKFEPKTGMKDRGTESQAQRPGSFVFVDRSGKVHGGGKRQAHGGEPESRSPKGGGLGEKPPGYSASTHQKRAPLPDDPNLRKYAKGHEMEGRGDEEIELPPHPREMKKARSGKGPGIGPVHGKKAKDPKFQLQDKWARRHKGEVHERDRDAKRGPSRSAKHAPEKGRGQFKPRDRDRGPRARFDRKGFEKKTARAKGARKLKATVDKNRKGFGFLTFENRREEDLFVNPSDAELLFHGDRVEVTFDEQGEAVGIEVLEHRFKELVGRYFPNPSPRAKDGRIVYERKRTREEVYVPEGPKGAKSGDWVRATLVFHDEGEYSVTGEITDVFGEDLPARVDVQMIANEFNLIEGHSEAAEKEASAHRLEIPGKDEKGRVDLRETPFITIDGETARDFDDAVFVERSKSGHVLWVAIADVSHYVTPGTALDQEGFSRGTSVYFPERAFHMLPTALSTGLCSLRPKEPRLAMVAKIHYDRSTKITKTEVMEAVIESKRRATYAEIQAEAEKNGKDPNWEYAPHMELYRALRKMRSQRGSLDFDLPEAEVLVDEEGEPTEIKNRSRQDSHRLIEEFMIAANEAVTEWIMERGWPFVYRVHDEPTEVALEKFQQLAANMGVKVSIDRGPEAQAVLGDLIRRLDGHPAQHLLNMALLRSMKQAIYSSTHGIHYGLASRAYTHFTSPIRRYPDLVVHRMLKLALHTEQKKIKKPAPGEIEELEEKLAEICEHCSYRERLAADADREAIRLKQVRIMRRHLGDEFEGKIVGLTERGMFVALDDPYVEGFISVDSMDDDYYQFNEQRMVLAGRRKKRTFQIGNKVRVRVARADLDRREVDFAILDSKRSR